MTTSHTELCEKLRYEAKAIMSSFASEDHLFAHFFEAADLIEQQAARIQQQALEYVSLQAQCDEHLGRIAELEADRDCWRDQASQRLADWDAMRKERDALKVDAERLDFVIDKQGIIVSQTGADGVRHYQLYQICEYGTGVILSGKALRLDTPRDAIDAALQAEKETRS